MGKGGVWGKSSDDDDPPNPPTLPQLVNPFSKTHGAPDDEERHVGDLGNFKTDSNGNAEGTITDKNVKLIGPTSVLGVSETPPPQITTTTTTIFPSLSLSPIKAKGLLKFKKIMYDMYIFSGLLSYMLAPTIWVKAVTNRARLREMLVVGQLVGLLVLRTEYVGGGASFFSLPFSLFFLSNFLSSIPGERTGERDGGLFM